MAGLGTFIESDIDAIVDEWVAFARTLLPARTMTELALRDHIPGILRAIVRDMAAAQTAQERKDKSRRLSHPARPPPNSETAAAAHGAARQLSGFDIQQVVAEYRALRASVLARWPRAEAAPAGGVGREEEIARFHEAIDEALAQSVERYAADVAKSRDMFLAVLGHDVRGPLSGIQMATDVLEMPGLAEPVRLQVAMRVRRAADSIAGLTRDLLEYTRSRLGRGIPVERSPCDLRQICEEAIDSVKGIHPDRQFAARFSGDLGAECDAERMHQVLGNLFSNAVQHGEPRLPVELAATAQGDHVELTMTNFGTPIPRTSLQVIFEPLIQVPSGPSDPHERPRTSLGLGLFIVKEIVEGHGGTIDVASSVGTGTTFTIRLPRRAPVTAQGVDG